GELKLQQGAEGAHRGALSVVCDVKTPVASHCLATKAGRKCIWCAAERIRCPVESSKLCLSRNKFRRSQRESRCPDVTQEAGIEGIVISGTCGITKLGKITEVVRI